MFYAVDNSSFNMSLYCLCFSDRDEEHAYGAIEDMSVHLTFAAPAPSDSDIQSARFSCQCKHNKGKPCHTQFSASEIDSMRLQYLALTHDELDIAVLAKGIQQGYISAQQWNGRKRESRQ